MVKKSDIKPPLVGVIAGTPFDANLGAAYVDSLGFNSIPKPLSETVSSQTALQFDPAMLEKKLIDSIDELVKQGCEKILIYCNSILFGGKYGKGCVSYFSSYCVTLVCIRGHRKLQDSG